MKTIVALSVVLVAAAAIAEDRPAKNPEAVSEKSAQTKFEALDRNKDAALSKIEARADAAVATQFASMDINADGYISKREYIAKMTQPRSSPPPYSQ